MVIQFIYNINVLYPSFFYDIGYTPNWLFFGLEIQIEPENHSSPIEIELENEPLNRKLKETPTAHNDKEKFPNSQKIPKFVIG